MNATFKSVIFFTVLISDQVTKYLALTYLSTSSQIPIIPGLFNLTLVHNRGAAFGMFSGLPDFWRRVVLIGVSCLALIVVFRFMLNEAKGDKVSQFALIGILGGAVGNIIDRIRFDSVVDFLDFYYGTYHWPAFNIADSAICVGVFFLIFRMLFGNNHSPQITASAI